MTSLIVWAVLTSVWLGVAVFELSCTWRLDRSKPVVQRALLALGAFLWPLGLLTLLWPSRITGRSPR